MSWYRRSKFAFDSFRKFRDFGTKNTFSQNPIQKTRPFTTPSAISPLNRRYPVSESTKGSPFLFGGRRNYYIDHRQVTHFRPKGYKKWPNWKLHLTMLSLFGVGYYMFSETIPYSNRTHLVFLSHNVEKIMGELAFKKMKETHRILPGDDPQSVRVRLIAKNLVNALQIVQSNDYSCLNWEFFVVENSSCFESGCLPGGKIYICTGDLSCCETDAEIAVILAHEIGHVVARHSAEKLSKLWLMRRLASSFKSTEKVIDDWLVQPLSRKHENEADYIGMLLMASAGYDPLVTLIYWKKVMKKFRDLSETYKVELKVKSTHPSFEKRLEMLSRPTVMEKALRLYQERIDSNGLPENRSQN